MRILRGHREVEEQLPTTAELRQARSDEWAAVFRGPADAIDYRRAFPRYSPLDWGLIETTQRDLLRLLVGRVPAELGVPAIFGLIAVFGGHAKADEAARASLAMIVNELRPPHARTLLVSLADAWQNAEQSPYEGRDQLIRREYARTLRRLESTGAAAHGVISALAALLAPDEPEEMTGDA